jgi:colicin import membrane protein
MTVELRRWLAALGTGALLLAPVACEQRKGDQQQARRGGEQAPGGMGTGSSAAPAQEGAARSSEQAGKAQEQAADAQKKAADEQKQVAGAQKEVREEQKDVGEARQKEQKERSEAQQAQQQAQASSQQAQSSSQQAQPQAGSTSSAQASKTATGKVVSASAQELVLKPAGGQAELRLKVSSDTPVMIGGQKASITDLKEGTQVSAAYDEAGGQPTATKIEAQK